MQQLFDDIIEREKILKENEITGIRDEIHTIQNQMTEVMLKVFIIELFNF